MKESDYFPAGAYRDPNAPYNQSDVPEKEFEVTCSQSLSRTATVCTNNYIPGASGVDYEDDGEGGCCACGWQDDDDTSDTDWSKEYSGSNHYTPLQLIQMFKERCELELKALSNSDLFEVSPIFYKNKRLELKHLIEECDCWTEDDIEFCEG